MIAASVMVFLQGRRAFSNQFRQASKEQEAICSALLKRQFQGWQWAKSGFGCADGRKRKRRWQRLIRAGFLLKRNFGGHQGNMGRNGGINWHALQRPRRQKLRPPHFKRSTLHQNGGAAFHQYVNRGEMGWRFFLPDGDAVNKVPNAIGAALKHHTLIGQQQQIFARRHIPKNTGQDPDKGATIGNIPYAKHALKRRNAGGDGQEHHARPKPGGKPIPA
jgi:hypothetical protein